MTGLFLRSALVVLLIGVAWLAVARLERRRGRPPGLPPGVTLVTGPDCPLCGPAERALRAGGIDLRTVDVADVGDRIGAVMSLPVALVVDAEGRVVLRRAGRSAITDVDSILRAGRAVAAPTSRTDPLR